MRGEQVLYYGKKLLIFIISVWVLSLVTFYVSRLAPGDPLISYYGERVEKMSLEEREWAEEKMGLNEKISVQYARWIRQAFHGNFGISYKYKMDVLEVLKSRIAIHWFSEELAFWSYFSDRCFWEWCVHGKRADGQTG